MKFRNSFNLRHIALFVAAVVVTVTLVAATSRAETPANAAQASPALAPDAPQPLVITYQGRLLDRATGEPKPDGDYVMLFGLYTVNIGGTSLWEEKQTVPVSNGLFSVTLGNETGNSIDPGMFDGYARWLSILVSGDGEFMPRIRVASAPYAIWSNLAQNASNADRLGGALPGTYHDATLLTGGPISTDRYDARADLLAQGYLGNLNGDLAQNNSTVQATLNADLLDGSHSSAFSLTTHNHDAAYVNVSGDTMNETLTVFVPSSGSHGISAFTASTASGAAAVEAKNTGAGFGLNAYSESREAVYASAANSHGILSYTTSTTNGHAAVAGVATASSGTVAGIKGQSSYSNGYAGYFIGNVVVYGTLSKSAGGFTIDHPLDPETKILNHSFVESPDMMNVYNGNVVLDGDGKAWVDLPAWFEPLNRDFRYQLTPIGGPGPNLYIAQKVQNSRFQIAGGSPGLEVSWQVTGIRQDPYADTHRIPVEQDKPADQQGTYLNPDAYGLPASRSPYYEAAVAPAVQEQPVAEPQKP